MPKSNQPNTKLTAARRKKARTVAMDNAKAEDLRGTRIPKSKQKERRVTGELRRQELPPEEKRGRHLKKLLKQIEALQERKDAGETLDEAQLQKLGRLDEVVAEIEELFGVDLGSSGDEEEEDDDNVKRKQQSKEGAEEKGDGEDDGAREDTKHKKKKRKQRR